MTIKQNGGVFGRNPTFNDVTIEGQLTFDGDIDINSDLKVQGEIESSGDIIVGSSGSIGVRDTNPVNGYVTVRGESTVGTKNGHIMLTGDSSTVGQGPQIVFSESGSGSNWVGGAIGFTRTGGSGIGDLSFSTRQTAGDANTTAVEAMKINSAGNVYVSTGNLVMSTSGKGIDFSATAGTGTSEILDDYEEANWSPVLTGSTSGSQTFTDKGRSTLVGRLMSVEFGLEALSSSDVTGDLIMSLPVTYTGASIYVPIQLYQLNHPTNAYSAYGFLESSTAVLKLFWSIDNAGSAAITNSDLPAGADAYIRGTFSYITS